MIPATLVVSSVLMGLLLSRQLGRAHPCALFAWAWMGVILVNALVPLRLYPVNGTTAAILAVGLLCFTVGSLAAKRKNPSATKVQRISGRSLRIWAVLASAALLIGTFYFQGRVAAAAGVADFGTLDATTIRYETTYGSARGGSFGVLLFALAPVVGCVGILAGVRLSRWWFLMVPLAFWATTQSPGRTFTLALAAAVVPFFLYSRIGTRAGAVSKRFITLASFASAGGALLYFNAIGTSLGKSTILSRYVPSTAVPDWLASAVLYQTGGISALSKAQNMNHDPMGAFGTSVYAVVRVGAAVGLPVNIPQTISDFVFIPMPFNVYTAFGQVWFDFGMVGVVAMFVAVGALTAYAHARALEGAVSWAWTSSLLLSVLASTPLTLRLLNVDVLVQLAVGLVIFWTVSRTGPELRQLREERVVPPTLARTPMWGRSVGRPETPRIPGKGG